VMVDRVAEGGEVVAGGGDLQHIAAGVEHRRRGEPQAARNKRGGGRVEARFQSDGVCYQPRDEQRAISGS